MSLPALSVIVPNFNHASSLPRCLTAIVQQSVPPIEVIVIDDASTDHSVEVIESFAKNHPLVHLYRNDKNLGVVKNIDRGISLSRGDYLAFAAADDEVAPGFFEKSLALLAQHPQAALSATVTEFREAHTGISWFWGAGIVDSPAYISPPRMVECERKGKFYIPPNSVIFRTSALREVGNFNPELKFCCDWYAMYVAGFRHGICFVPEPLAIFHVQANSYYHKIRRDPAEYRRVLELLLERLSDPANRDVLGLVREAGSLFLFGIPMLTVLLSRPAYRHLITPTFLRKNLLHAGKLFLKNHSPAVLVNSYLKLRGNRKPTATEPPQERHA